MARKALLQRIQEGTFILDGAMGTLLIDAGIEAGVCNEYLNIESPDLITRLHRAYIEVGTDAVTANTFGANAVTLKRHGLDDRVRDICLAAVAIAREAVGPDRYVLADMGPCGEFIEPLGTVKPDQLTEAFAAQAQALVDGGVDGFIIETMTGGQEMALAIEAVASVTDLPVLASFSFDPAGDQFRTMMGLDLAGALAAIEGLPAAAVGFNCGTLSMEQYVQLTEGFAGALEGSETILMAQPNAGQPELVDGKAIYSVGPEEFADSAEKISRAGARIVGGCCGTTPAHIEAVVRRLG